jgi:hypothetical protein
MGVAKTVSPSTSYLGMCSVKLTPFSRVFLSLSTLDRVKLNLPWALAAAADDQVTARRAAPAFPSGGLNLFKECIVNE